MQKLIIHRLFLVLILLSVILATSDAKSITTEKNQKNATIQMKESSKFKVTFIEYLGFTGRKT